MKKVLIPTDLAENATDSFNYLIPFLAKTADEIHVVHAVDDPFVKEERPECDEQGVEKYTSDIIYKMRREAENDLVLFIRKMETALQSTGSAIPVFAHIENGVADEVILQTAASIHPQLIIMGRHHHSKLERLFFGSITKSVMQKAFSPVLVFPENYQFEKPVEVLYMSDFDEKDVFSVGKLINLLQPFAVHLHVVHFNIHEIGNEEKLFRLGEQLRRDHVDIKIDYELVDGNILREAWQQYVAHKGIQLIALTAHQHNVMQQMLQQDTAADVLYHSNLPVLAIH
jgi:nucleotide-binding universal stress UspA family protein